MRALGYRTEEAADGREALARAIDDRLDMLVADTELPGIDGYDLCHLLRSDREMHDLPIVLVTGTSQPNTLHRAATAGADAVIVTPCLPADFFDTVRRLRQRSTELRALSIAACAAAEARLQRSAEVLAKSMQHKQARGRIRSQSTALDHPTLRCPLCYGLLTFTRSFVGGVLRGKPEQWDYYQCARGCGSFQFRQRTHKLRRLPERF